MSNKKFMEAIDSFYSALNAMLQGDSTPMKNLWSHADDVMYVGPTGGLLKGWKDVEAIWDIQAQSKLGGHVKPEQLSVIVGSDIGICFNYEIGTGHMIEGKLMDIKIRASSAFRLENNEWKMVSHQTDLF